ncbi:MAG: PIN domain-containing protein, partial [Fibromonadales bacterium]|nr:PIN domain-containing protein [Fibromonadales bacterium]
MANRYKTSDIPNISKRKMFFDANAMIYIYWPTTPNNDESKQYSNMLNMLLHQKNKLAISTSVISEIVNRVIKIEYEKKGGYKKIGALKKFRDSNDGKSLLNNIYSIIENKIFLSFNVSDKKFNKTEVKKMLKTDSLDFNDKIIFEICKKNNFILITHDA